ncbi:MAG: hypothetical protein KDI30_02170, partial [Pseudomonadales bacterium]|nr:hypothetical protein [Pseudomonadales bacterium]
MPPEPHNQYYFLALDQGSLSSRALLFDENAEIVFSASKKINTLRTKKVIEYNAEEIFHSLRTCIDEVMFRLEKKLAGDSRNFTVKASLITQRSTIVCWNRFSGEALGPAISWQDTRDSQWLEENRSRITPHISKTGLRLSPHYGANKIRWCVQNLPKVIQANLDNALVYGPLASFLLFRLTQEHTFAIDPANASRTLLYDNTTQQWDDAL